MKLIKGLLSVASLLLITTVGCVSGEDPVKPCKKNPANDTGEYCCLINATFPAQSGYRNIENEFWTVIPPVDPRGVQQATKDFLTNYIEKRGGKLVKSSCVGTAMWAMTPTRNPCFWNPYQVMNQSQDISIEAVDDVLVRAFSPPCKICSNSSPACNACANAAYTSSACTDAANTCSQDADCSACVSCLDAGNDIATCGCQDTASMALGACLLSQCPICNDGSATPSTSDEDAVCWDNPANATPPASTPTPTQTCIASGNACNASSDCCSKNCIGTGGLSSGVCS